MKKVTREFVKIAYHAMQQAYYHESDVNNGEGEYRGLDDNTEAAKKVGEVLQAVSNLSRSL